MKAVVYILPDRDLSAVRPDRPVMVDARQSEYSVYMGRGETRRETSTEYRHPRLGWVSAFCESGGYPCI